MRSRSIALHCLLHRVTLSRRPRVKHATNHTLRKGLKVGKDFWWPNIIICRYSSSIHSTSCSLFQVFVLSSALSELPIRPPAQSKNMVAISWFTSTLSGMPMDLWREIPRVCQSEGGAAVHRGSRALMTWRLMSLVCMLCGDMTFPVRLLGRV